MKEGSHIQRRGRGHLIFIAILERCINIEQFTISGAIHGVKEAYLTMFRL